MNIVHPITDPESSDIQAIQIIDIFTHLFTHPLIYSTYYKLLADNLLAQPSFWYLCIYDLSGKYDTILLFKHCEFVRLIAV